MCVVCVSLLSLLGNGSVKYQHMYPFTAKQHIGKHVPAETNTHSNRKLLDVCTCGSAYPPIVSS
jgi:hypothetical protein